MIGEKIKKLRLKKKLTQDEVANFLYVTPQAVSKWENNISIPDTNFLVSIADLFGVSVDYLLRDPKNDSIKILIEQIKKQLSFEHSIDKKEYGTEVEGVVKNKSEYNLRSVNYKAICYGENDTIVDSPSHSVFYICANGEVPFSFLSWSKKEIKKVEFLVQEIKIETKNEQEVL